MPLFCLASPKGGVGKTTLTANLAGLLHRDGHRVLVIDLDPQNALRLHFGLPVSDEAGFIAGLVRRRSWRSAVRETDSGVLLLPHGTLSMRSSLEIGRALQQDGELLAQPLRELLADPDLIVLADTPPGPSAALLAIAPLAEAVIAVLLADAASAALIPQIAARRFLGRGTLTAAVNRRMRVVLNQVDESSALSMDVLDCAVERLGASLIGAICRDSAVAEALGSQALVCDTVEAAPALDDLAAVAEALLALLPAQPVSKQHRDAQAQMARDQRARDDITHNDMTRDDMTRDDMSLDEMARDEMRGGHALGRAALHLRDALAPRRTGRLAGNLR